MNEKQSLAVGIIFTVAWMLGAATLFYWLTLTLYEKGLPLP